MSRPDFPKKRIDAIAAPFQKFVHTEAAGGAVLLVAATIALAVANSPFASQFESFWAATVGLRIGDAVWEYPLRHWINDGLVTLFFFVIGLEIKREMVWGELKEPGIAALPIVAAVGGMVVPAAVYLVLASGPQSESGWGVVMATDIAFVVGCLALLGNRIPASLRLTILSLAIIDDIGAILAIAIGYSHGFHAFPFAIALLGFGVTALMQWLGVRPVLAYWFAGLCIWAALHESGIHPTIAGVALGLLTPAKPWVDNKRLERFLMWAGGVAPSEHDRKSARRVLARAAQESLSPQQRLEDGLHPWSAFFILPLFALANAGVNLSAAGASDPITVAVIAGLVVGKPLGIFCFAWLAVKLGLAQKPEDMSWQMVAAAGLLSGIGFTMALFIGNLAFNGAALRSATLGILIASVISGAAGTAMLWVVSARK